jgi:hypothetical protein
MGRSGGQNASGDVKAALMGLAFVLTLFISAIIGSVVLMGPTMVLLVMQRGLYRRWNGVAAATSGASSLVTDSGCLQAVAKMWFQLVCILIEKIFGVEMIFYGESVH